MASGTRSFLPLLAAAAFALAALPVHAADGAAAAPDEPEIVFREDPASEDAPLIQGFRLPEYDGEGRLKRQATGDTARFLQDGLLEVTGLELSLYEEGTLRLVATSPRCVYDQGKQRAASREPLRVVTDTAVLTGDGFAWNGEAEQFQIFDHARLVVDTAAYDAEDALGFPAGGGADGEPGNNEESEK
ncbi:MAG: hypothetical protein IJS32_06365 [Kiritimatiellae bacterium]|nr:hypothetical protein [Kiritimatiellia bacterium]